MPSRKTKTIGPFLTKNYRWILIAVITPFFFVLPFQSTESRIGKELWDLGHVVFFGLFAVECLVWCQARGWSSRVIYTSTLLAVGVIALAIEVGQSFVDGRDSNLRDLAYGIVGGGSVLIWKSGTEFTAPKKVLLRLTAVLGLLGCGYPLFLTLADEYRMRQSFPVLSDFESFLDLSRWHERDRISRVTHPVNSGDFSLKVALTVAEFSGLTLQYFPGNWSTARALSFSVYNPADPVMLYYRVHDSSHQGENQHYDNRYNGKAMLQPGWNHLSIPIEEIENGPKTRKIDLKNIKGLMFFLFQQPDSRILYFDDVELVEK